MVASRFVGEFDGRSFRLDLDYPYSITLRHQAAFPELSVDHGGELPVAVELSQLDLTARDEAEEQDERAVLARQRALGLHSPAEFSVEPLDDVRCADRLHCCLGKRYIVSSSSPASSRLRTTPGQRDFHFVVKAPYAWRAAASLAA